MAPRTAGGRVMYILRWSRIELAAAAADRRHFLDQPDNVKGVRNLLMFVLHLLFILVTSVLFTNNCKCVQVPVVIPTSSSFRGAY